MGEVVNYGSLNYSTEEQIVGKWVDGKPLYQKTVYVGDCPAGSSTPTEVNHNISDIDMVIDAFGCARSITGSFREFIIIPYMSTNTNYNTSVYLTSSVIRLNITNASLATFNNCYVTLLYTKTTDTV